MWLEPEVNKLAYIFSGTLAARHNGSDSWWILVDLFKKVNSCSSGIFWWKTEGIHIFGDIIFFVCLCKDSGNLFTDVVGRITCQ